MVRRRKTRVNRGLDDKVKKDYFLFSGRPTHPAGGIMRTHTRPVALALAIGIVGFVVYFGFGSLSGRGEVGMAAACVFYLLGGGVLYQKYPASAWYGGVAINILVWAFFLLGADPGQFALHLWGLIACVGSAYAGTLIGFWLLKLKIVFSGTMKVLILAIPVVLILFMTYMLNTPRPIPSHRQAFVGVWTTGTGFALEIRADGTASLTQDVHDRGPAYENLNIKVAPSRIETANVEFRRDSAMTVVRHGYYAREYRIDRFPFPDSMGTAMVVNGMVLVKQR
jgi:hypothetical protein